ncbi:hypothetical protein ABZ892_13530 [Streptomyces sp. NPDC046924]|uniref:hypothetical protein n=1 Tax=Streptomyces sp. NPDC046924 TaxID=3155136 RepID=UPI0033EA9A8A
MPRGLSSVRSTAAFQYTGLAVDTDGGLRGWGSGLVLGDHGKGRADGTPVRITAPGPVLEVPGRHVIVEAASEETEDGAGAADRGWSPAGSGQVPGRSWFEPVR